MPKNLQLSQPVRSILHKLPSADAVSVMEDLLSKVADNNNANNFSKDAGALTQEEMVKKLQSIPEGQLRSILQQHGITQ